MKLFRFQRYLWSLGLGILFYMKYLNATGPEGHSRRADGNKNDESF
jgi:hypothetical protein